MNIKKGLTIIITLLSLTFGLLRQELKYILIGAVLLLILEGFSRYKNRKNKQKPPLHE